MFSNLWSSMFKTFISRSVFGKLQLTHITLNFKVSGLNFKIRGLERKACEGFVLLSFAFYLFMYNFVSLLCIREKQSLNFFTRLYRHLWLLQGYVWKKITTFFKRDVSTMSWLFQVNWLVQKLVIFI